MAQDGMVKQYYDSKLVYCPSVLEDICSLTSLPRAMKEKQGHNSHLPEGQGQALWLQTEPTVSQSHVLVQDIYLEVHPGPEGAQPCIQNPDAFLALCPVSLCSGDGGS